MIIRFRCQRAVVVVAVVVIVGLLVKRFAHEMMMKMMRR